MCFEFVVGRDVCDTEGNINSAPPVPLRDPIHAGGGAGS